MRTSHFAVMLPLLMLVAQSSGAQDLPITTLSSRRKPATHTLCNLFASSVIPPRTGV